ncbi:MAG: energy transducer TonB, partial [Bacteroidetes bacterium]|nr:energy transducer TonB [Bacteroidota bacterium]
MMKYLLLLLIAASSFVCSAQTNTPVYDFVEEMPKFPGGEDSLWRFIKANLTYPEKEKQDSIQGKVIVGFVVNEEGLVTNPEVKRGVSPGLDAEALRLVSILPKFAPGKQQGKHVKVKYVLPIVFKLGYKTKLMLPSTIEMVVMNGSSNLADYKLGFANGDSAFAALVIKNLLYPKKERENRIEGKAIITCEVNADGSLDTIYIGSSSGNKALDDEAWRVVKLAAKFQPTLMNGKAMPVAFNVPIKFIAPKDEYYRVPLLQASTQPKESVKYNVANGDTIYLWPDIAPESPLTPEDMMDLIDRSIVYPEFEFKQKKIGRVILRFVVDTAGYVTDPEILRGLTPALDAEAIRVVKLLPKFEPGKKHDGTVVKTYYSFPVSFTLQTYNKPSKNIPDTSSAKKEFKLVDQQPEFPGGDIGLIRFL